MKLVYTFYHDNEGNLIKSDTKAVIKGRVFDCDLYNHFGRYAYIMTKVEKRESYRYIDGIEMEEANIKVHTSEAWLKW